MEQTIYIVSYSSYREQLYNNVILFKTKEDAIESANAYVEDANNDVCNEHKTIKRFDEYENGYKEIEVIDYHSGCEYLISITEFNNIK